MSVRRAWLALGGNVGDRLGHFRAAVNALVEGGVAVDRCSSVYDTPPWGIVNQPRFANAVVSGTTELDAHALLQLCKRIERAAGRNFEAERNSARPIDVDILLIEGERVDEPDLVVPHAAMHARAFVLVPLTEVAPDLVHPVLGRTVRELVNDLSEAERADVTVIEGPGWCRDSARLAGA